MGVLHRNPSIAEQAVEMVKRSEAGMVTDPDLPGQHLAEVDAMCARFHLLGCSVANANTAHWSESSPTATCGSKWTYTSGSPR